MNTQSLLDFFAEAGQLKRVKRSGWWLAGIPVPESVADHVTRAMMIGHILADLENADSGRVLLLILYHDLPEARLNDGHKIASRYIDYKPLELKVFKEQMRKIGALGSFLVKLFANKKESLERKIAKDADLLECVIQGKEYFDQGFKQTTEWFSDKTRYLHTKSAKKLYNTIVSDWDSTHWRKGLKKFT